MKKVTLIIGPQGSGKTTKAREIISGSTFLEFAESQPYNLDAYMGWAKFDYIVFDEVVAINKKLVDIIKSENPAHLIIVSEVLTALDFKNHSGFSDHDIVFDVHELPSGITLTLDLRPEFKVYAFRKLLALVGQEYDPTMRINVYALNVLLNSLHTLSPVPDYSIDHVIGGHEAYFVFRKK